MSIASAVFSIFDWIKDKLPIPNRLEGIKNEIDKLEQERKIILRGKADAKKSKRLMWIDARLELLYKRLSNSTDSA